MKGTESLKALLEFIFIAINKTIDIDSDHDNKVSFTEILSMLTTMSFKIPGIVSAIPEVRAEWKDLTREETDEIVKWFIDKFDLPPQSDKVEAMIKKTIMMVQYNVNYIKDMKALLMP